MVAQCSGCRRATAYCSHSAIQRERGETRKCEVRWRKYVSKCKGGDRTQWKIIDSKLYTWVSNSQRDL